MPSAAPQKMSKKAKKAFFRNIEHEISADRDSVLGDSWMLSYIDTFLLINIMLIIMLFITSVEYDTQIEQTMVEEMPQEVSAASDEKQPEPSSDVTQWQQELEKTLEYYGLLGKVEYTSNNDYTQLQVQDHVLFALGDAELTEEGEAVLESLLPLLKMASGLILIEGHTDSLPIQTAYYPSNWELGAARASNVLRYFVEQGMPANSMRAVSYADTMPIDDNNTEEGRAKNRRVNFILRMPEFDEP